MINSYPHLDSQVSTNKQSSISNSSKLFQMKLWQRVSGALKDRNSLWLAAALGHNQFRNPALEAALIKATSHDHRFVDYKNTQRVFTWIRTSPSSLLPFLVALSRRLTRTRSSTVAIKGLMLFHGVLCTKLPSTRKIGRLPFDLSAFDHAFVRSYFNFLDRKSVGLPSECPDPENLEVKQHKETISQRLEKLDRWQELLDLLLQIRPTSDVVVIFEAMDCVIIEVFDVYSKICDGIANVMIRIYAAAEPDEASSALEVLRRSMRQADELSQFFEICREMRVLSESECPKVEKVSEDDVRELERIIKRGPVRVEAEEEVDSTSKMTTVITDKWEVFEEELKVGDLIDLCEDDYPIMNPHPYGYHNHSTASNFSMIVASNY